MIYSSTETILQLGDYDHVYREGPVSINKIELTDGQFSLSGVEEMITACFLYIFEGCQMISEIY